MYTYIYIYIFGCKRVRCRKVLLNDTINLDNRRKVGSVLLSIPLGGYYVTTRLIQYAI